MLVAAASILSGFAGYYLHGSSSHSSSRDEPSKQVVPAKSELNSQYGSPEDFKRAIRELEETFPSEDKVSTDPEVLHVHGYSENDYHPGKQAVICQKG